MHPALAVTDHRPWPLPQAKWFMQMDWEELLFAHWPLPPAQLRPLMPAGLEPDTFDGEAWIGVVPFRMNRVRARLFPPLPGAGRFPEINLRTYVRAGDVRGVWFFSLDTPSWLSVRIARRGFSLPYFDARMSIDVQGDDVQGDEVRYAHVRSHRGAPPAGFRAVYRPDGPVFRSTPGSLEHFLTERYCLFAARGATLLRADVAHAPWPLQPAQAELHENTLARPHGLRVPDVQPLLHYSKALRVVAWSPRRVGANR